MGFFAGFLLSFFLSWIILRLPSAFLPLSNALWRDEFIERYPEKKWIPFLYPIFLYGGLFGFLALGVKFLPVLQYESLLSTTFYIFSFGFAGAGASVGIFEILTCVSPVPLGTKQLGNSIFRFKAPWIHKYHYNPHLPLEIRRIGIIRLFLELIIITLLIALGNFSPK